MSIGATRTSTKTETPRTSARRAYGPRKPMPIDARAEVYRRIAHAGSVGISVNKLVVRFAEYGRAAVLARIDELVGAGVVEVRDAPVRAGGKLVCPVAFAVEGEEG